jgi:MerR family transcriptional regulator, light-induced transcriptional regulator
MNDRVVGSLVSLSISSVERDVGLSKDTLRVWERRYGFPRPDRDAFGERVYPMEQVDKLRIVRRLMDAGYRPGKIINLPVEQLQKISAELSIAPRSLAEANHEQEDLQKYIELTKEHKIEELRSALSQAALRTGMDQFVMKVVAPLNRMVGDAWARGYFEIFEEHIYTESIQVVMRNAISSIPASGLQPRVLLTTFPQESHGLGLLMAEALLTLNGARCFSLGVQTPIWDIVLAANSQKVDIVALSFSATLNPNLVVDGLAELRAKLSPSMEIWAGGQCPVLQRKPPADIIVMSELADIHKSLNRWRNSHTQASSQIRQ